MQQLTPALFADFLARQGEFDSEEFGFAIEAAFQYGFEMDLEACPNGTVLRCTDRQLFTLMRVIGWRRAGMLPLPGHASTVSQLVISQQPSTPSNPYVTALTLLPRRIDDFGDM